MGGQTVIVALFAAAVLLSCDDASADEWHGQDKRQHALAGALVAGTAAQITGSRWHGFLAGAAVGVGKELVDMRMPGHTPSYKDAIVTLAGAALAVSHPGLSVGPGWITYRLEF